MEILEALKLETSGTLITEGDIDKTAEGYHEAEQEDTASFRQTVEKFRSQGPYEFFGSNKQEVMLGQRQTMTFESEGKPLKVREVKWLDVRSFTLDFQGERERRSHTMVAAILEGEQISFSTQEGQELLRITDVHDQIRNNFTQGREESYSLYRQENANEEEQQ